MGELASGPTSTSMNGIKVKCCLDFEVKNETPFDPKRPCLRLKDKAVVLP
jgi:hypothetical protein